MPRGHRLTPEQRERIRELRAQGLSERATAQIVGCGPKTVGRVAPGRRASHFLTPEQVAQIKALRADGHTCLQVAQIVGCHWTTVRKYAPGLVGKVPVVPLREAFERSPLTTADVARELGWWATHNGHVSSPDTSRVKRTLGLLPTTSGTTSRRSYRTLVDAETVMRIADVIGVGWWTVVPDEDGVAA